MLVLTLLEDQLSVVRFPSGIEWGFALKIKRPCLLIVAWWIRSI